MATRQGIDSASTRQWLFNYDYLKLIRQRATASLTSTYRTSANWGIGQAYNFVLSFGSHPLHLKRGRGNDQAERFISTPELNVLPRLDPEPINVVVYHESSGLSLIHI